MQMVGVFSFSPPRSDTFCNSCTVGTPESAYWGWRIEQAFNLVKRLLGLSYLWTGSINGVKLQVWATWACFKSR